MDAIIATSIMSAQMRNEPKPIPKGFYFAPIRNQRKARKNRRRAIANGFKK